MVKKNIFILQCCDPAFIGLQLFTCQPVLCPSILQPVLLHILQPAALQYASGGPLFLSYTASLPSPASPLIIFSSSWSLALVPGHNHNMQNHVMRWQWNEVAKHETSMCSVFVRSRCQLSSELWGFFEGKKVQQEWVIFFWALLRSTLHWRRLWGWNDNCTFS